MKKLFTILAVAAACVACQKNEIVALDNGEAIAFGNAFVENAVRATDPSYSANDIAYFKVYGTVDASNGNPVVIYPGATVTKTADYGVAWTCKDAEDNEIKQYWIPGATYKFVGIVDGDKENVSETTLVNGMPTTISYKADGVTDLLCQTIDKVANTDGTANGLVAFTFNHLLAKVNFTVKNNSADADKYSFVVKNIAFAGNTEGVYNVATAAWDTAQFKTGSTAVGNDTDKTIIVATKAASSELNTEVLFLPGTYSVSFTVDILYDGTVITTTNYPASGSYSHTLEAGKAYNFIAEVAVGELIQFTVTEQPEWDTPTNDVEL